MGAWQWPPLTNYDFCYYTYNCLTFLWLHFSRERQDKPSRQKNAQTDRQTGIDRETLTEAVDFSLWRPWQRGQTDRKADRQVGRQTGRLAGRQEERESRQQRHTKTYSRPHQTQRTIYTKHTITFTSFHTHWYFPLPGRSWLWVRRCCPSPLRLPPFLAPPAQECLTPDPHSCHWRPPSPGNPVLAMLCPAERHTLSLITNRFVYKWKVQVMTSDFQYYLPTIHRNPCSHLKGKG